ncbi:hypothetical protein [Glycomyces algeriensis]|uniref:PPE family protein n=1 Tax=Glycomyces algeriensis TaxID=256037 RepID=A0A9W6LDW0_9ACTN|nr:hypothetical protein [Glycomyces algeriensis]MDA1366991.1 hypothetical protein [Glycomyces algeriensis]MDR7352622.1 hypothetical protein [Glycomyces algeriensis]GLI40302.1 hypothetical protein GALLR39Z86_01520 [Glycomyces algeriensis]
MAAKGKGVDYYKSTYTHQQLWDMLHEGDDYTVEQAGYIWVSAASGMKAAREEMSTHVESLRLQWTGPASDEFHGRMNLVKQYSVESEEGMKLAGETKIPNLASALKTAQVNSASLDPAFIDEYEDWVESKKQVDPASAEAQSKKTLWQQEYQNDLNAKHTEMAQIVADLGDVYAAAAAEDFGELPPPPPSDMPGSNTYTKPTGGVFSETALNPSNSLGSAPADQSADLDGDGFADAPGDFDPVTGDLDPVDGEWNPGSYDDVDSDVTGGLAGSTLMPAGGGGGGFTAGGGGGGLGGSPLAGGTGLFGPSQSSGSGANRGAGSSPARSGANGTKPGSSPARSGANSSSRGGNTGNRLSSSSRNTIGRGGSGGGNNPRGGTRSGYNDDDDEETYTRETWLREDDVDWSQNNVRREELDDDDDD